MDDNRERKKREQFREKKMYVLVKFITFAQWIIL